MMPEFACGISQVLDHHAGGAVFGPDGLGGCWGFGHVYRPAGLDVDVALVGRLEDQDKVSGRNDVTWATAGRHLVRHCHFIVDFLHNDTTTENQTVLKLLRRSNTVLHFFRQPREIIVPKS